MPICCGASGAHALTFDPLCQAGAPDARTDLPGPERWLLQTWPISTYYYCASTRPRLNFTLIDSLSLSFSCKDHFSWKWTGSFQVLFMINWVFPFWNCQCCFFCFVFFFVNIAVVIVVAVVDVISFFCAFLFFGLCVSMQWSLW